MIDILPWQRDTLSELIGRGERLPHALLVHGRSGVGKVEFARSLAQSLLCESPEQGLACGQCHACGWFSNGNHPDFRELLPEALVDEDASEEAAADTDSKDKKKSKEIKIDQIRGIADFMTLSTHRHGYRVLLIHPAEAMNLAAANALLKTLEEPAARTVILLVTDKIGRLLATVRSRCQKVLVPTPDAAVALAWLKMRGMANADDAGGALAASGGGPLDVIAFAEADYQQVRKAFVSALSESAMDYALTAQNFEKAELANLLMWLQAWVNDVISERMVGVINHHRDQAKAITRIARQIELPKVFRYESELRQTRRLINHPLNARLLLEQLFIGYKQAIRPVQ